MKWLSSLFMILIASLLVASPGLSVKVYAIDGNAPSEYSVDGVPVSVYDTNKNTVASFVTTKEGGTFIAPWDTKIYIIGGLNNVVYGDANTLYVANVDQTFCRTNNGECQKGEGSVMLKARVMEQSEPKKEGMSAEATTEVKKTDGTDAKDYIKTDTKVESSYDRSKTGTIIVRAVDEKTAAGASNEGVLVYAVASDQGQVIGSVVTGSNGAKIEIPLETRFYVYTKDSKDGRIYYSAGVYYLKYDGNYLLCAKDGSNCVASNEVVLKPYQVQTSQPSTQPTPAITKEEIKTAIKPTELYKMPEGKNVGISVMVIDENGQQVKNAKLRLFYSEYGKSGAEAETNENGEAKLEATTGTIFYVVSNEKYYSDKYIVKEDRLCDLSSGGDCSTYLRFKLVQKSYAYSTTSSTTGIAVPAVTVPIMIKPIAQSEDYYTLNLNKGWNLVSVPLKDAKQIKNSCDSSKIFVYDGNANAYKRGTLDSLYLAPMQAFWIKANGECSVAFTGSAFKSYNIDGLSLGSGWNMLGAAANEAGWNDVKGSCETKSGPWNYNTVDNKWERAKSLVPGLGYLVKVVDKCALGSNDGAPPLPPN